MVDIVISPIEKAMTDAIEKVIGAVAAGAASATEVAQTTAGAQGTAGGTAVDAGQSSQSTQTGAAHKNDVSAPEVIESFNVHALKDLGIANKALVAQYIAETASNSKLYDITATALGLATLGATHNMTLQQQMASDHRDQNHDKQINIDEQVAAAAALYGRLFATLNNPIPPLKT
jgi:hypothetical protein